MSCALMMAFTKCPQITLLQVGIHKQTLYGFRMNSDVLIHPVNREKEGNTGSRKELDFWCGSKNITDWPESVLLVVR